MIGLLKLTLPNGEPLYVNPGMITAFAPNTEENAISLGLDPHKCIGKGSFFYIAGMCYQLQENPNMIINSITRLRQKAEKNAIEMKKRSEKEDWEDYEDEDEESD